MEIKQEEFSKAKDILLKVVTIQEIKNEEADKIELTTEGKLYVKDSATYISYDESELSGVNNNKVVLKIKDNSYVQMKRYGEFKTEMNFEEKRRDVSMYSTPYGEFRVEILTDKVEIISDENHSNIYIEYTVSVAGTQEIKHKLNISYWGKTWII